MRARPGGAFLQFSLGVRPDGAIGPTTLKALAAVNDRGALVERIRPARVSYYRALFTFPTFGRGWLSRLTTVSAAAEVRSGFIP